jgi:GR25 family glycosyltransferase involved in LPS biosynthesis
MVSAYLINLEGERTRRNNCIESWPFTEIELKIVNAINQSSLDPTYVTPGVAAIWASHKKAMLEFLSSGEDYAIILEDDFQFINVSRFRDAMDTSIKNEVDFLQFGFLITGLDILLSKFLKNCEYQVFRVAGSFLSFIGVKTSRMRFVEAANYPRSLIPFQVLPGAHAYLISRRLAKAIVDSTNEQFLAADNFFMSLAPMRTFKITRVKESTIGQRKIPSTIDNRFKNL